MSDKKEVVYKNMTEFYPYYLKEHSNPINRILHVAGSTMGALLALYALFSGRYMFILLALVIGYAFAWVGHFVFEKNKPATFKYPLMSYMSDWVMLKDIYTGKRSIYEFAKNNSTAPDVETSV